MSHEEPTPASAAELIQAIGAGDAAAVRRALAADPALARARDESGVSAICLAVYFGQEPIAREIAARRDDLDVFEASVLGDAARVGALLAREPALADAYSPDGFHPLGYACFFGRVELFELLLAAGASLEAPARNPMRVRPLHSAVAQADAELALRLARGLLHAGASPDVVQQGGYTPLHEAARRGHAPLVRELLAHGADVRARTDEGKTAADLARENGHPEVAALCEGGG